MTYIPTREGWLYLAVVLDLFSRRIVGWSMAATIDSALVCGALEMAWRQRVPGKGLIFHSDRGSQYASRCYTGLSCHRQLKNPQIWSLENSPGIGGLRLDRLGACGGGRSPEPHTPRRDP